MNPALRITSKYQRLGIHLSWSGLLGVAMFALGCGGGEAQKAELPPPMVTVANPVEKMMTLSTPFQGRAEPQEQVEIRARVTGYLIKAEFAPGKEIEKGKLLFQIDPDLYKAELSRADAEVAQTQARVERTTKDLARVEKLGVPAISEIEMDKARGDKLEADAALKVAQAKATSAKLNLDYTKINSPITGLIGDELVSEGNLVVGGMGNTTLLSTIVTVDPMDVSFDMDENTLQRLQKASREGKIKVANRDIIPIEAGLAVHGNEYPFKGIVNFVNNRVDQKTGTIRIKAEVANPKTEVGSRVIKAGMYMRVRLPIGEPYKAVLVPDSAIGSDQGKKFLYTIGPDNKAVRLDAVTGVLQDDLREIVSVRGIGEEQSRPLRTDEKIIVSGLQRVRPGLIVDPKPAKK